MAIFRSISLVCAVASASVQATTYLSPAQDIVLPASGSASNPLKWLGANSPYFAGPNINGISNEVPENCYVDQVAYVVRHGSRFPDTGAYNQWVTLYEKIQAATYTATEEMGFLKTWQPVLTNPTFQISQESPTGWKEAFDLGYQLRTRYPDLYAAGTPFISWANLYPRVVQTAQNFVRGFLGNSAATLGTVITVNSTGSPEALFDSLSPSDLCPNFVDASGGTNATAWAAIYLPPITARVNAMISGTLNFTTADVSLFPYLCGFESQITGKLSPWCGVFSDAELKQYEYAQDLRYYFGVGPGVDLPSKMMLPFLNSLVGLLAQGPGINGTFANGTSYVLPDIITAFLNDGQITELGAATGVWDDSAVLSGLAIPDDWTYIASHFVSMRGTVTFERLTCAVPVKIKARNELQGLTTVTKKKAVTITICPTDTGLFPSVTSTPAVVPPEWITSTILYTKVYTITSCKPEVTNCPVGKVTSTVYTTTTICPVAATETGGASSATGGSASRSGSIVGSGPGSSIRTGSISGSGVKSTSSGSGSGSVSSPGSGSLTAPFSSSTLASSTGVYSNTASTSSFSSDPNATSTYSYSNATSSATSSATSMPTSGSTNQTYIRILLNDAVYPVPSCQDGPGKSCLLSKYVSFIQARLDAVGDLKERCNVTASGSPDTLKGASFFTDLSDSWLASVVP